MEWDVPASNLPEILYRYQPLRAEPNWAASSDWNRFRDVVERRSIWFSSVDRFNDPFEGLVSATLTSDSRLRRAYFARVVDKEKTLSRGERRTLRRQVEKEIGQNFDFDGRPGTPAQKIGVLCMMEDASNLLAWAHYAAGHQGIVFGFKPRKTRPYNVFTCALPIEYVNEKPVIRVGEDDEKVYARVLLYSKSKCWEYEREWRVFSGYTPWPPESIGIAILGGEVRTGSALAEFVSTPPSVNAFSHFDHEDLVEIRLGASLSEARRRDAIALVREHFPGANILQAHLAKSRFALEFEMVD